MQGRETFLCAWRALSADKSKTLLTVLGVAIGSASMVLVITISSVAQTYIISRVQAVGSNLAYAMVDHGSVWVPDDELSPADMQAVRDSVPGISHVAGTYDVPVSFRIGSAFRNGKLVAVTSEFQHIRNLQITSGRYFDPDDFTERNRACLASDELAASLFQSDSALRHTITVGEFRCTVIGTFREGVPTFNQSEIQDQTVLIPFPLIREVTGTNYFKVLYAQAASTGDVAGVTRNISDVLAARHRHEVHYSVQNLSSVLRSARHISVAMTLLLVAIAAVTLSIAGAGIMNIMFVNVSQRTQEIGLRKAVGARKLEIRVQFLIEAVAISLVGGGAGVIAALAAVEASAHWVSRFAPVSLPWGTLPAAVLSCAAVGIFFGYKPASAAANLNPVEALRFE